jgi:hypothetical protein
VIAQLAITFLGIASIADLSRQDRSRMMLGHWRQLFKEHDLRWANEIVLELKRRGMEEQFLAAQDAFERLWFFDTDVNPQLETPTRKIAEHLSMTHYESMLNQEIYLHEFEVMIDSDNNTWRMDYPVLMRIVDTRREDVIRWTDNKHLDPYWDIQILAPPDLAKRHRQRSTWIYGPSIHLVPPMTSP